MRMATIKSVVATGRRMKMREGFTALLRWRWFAAPLSASRAGGAGRGRLAGRWRSRSRRRRRIRQLDLRAIAQPVAAFGDHDFAGLETRGYSNIFAIDHAQGH